MSDKKVVDIQWYHDADYEGEDERYIVTVGGFIEIPNAQIDTLELTEERRMGHFWIFSNNEMKGHNSVHFEGLFKVWKPK